MSVSWEIDLYFTRDDRDPEADTELEPTHFYGLPVYSKTVEADSYEHGSSGTLALYYEDEDDGLMRRSHSIRDPDLIGINARRVGAPDEPEPPEQVDSDEWEQGAA